MSKDIVQVSTIYGKQVIMTDLRFAVNKVKKILIFLTFLVLTFSSAYSQIELNQRVGMMIPFLSKNKQSLTNYLHQSGYMYATTQGSFSQYKKGSTFAYTFTFSERNSSITALNWTEFLGNYQFIINELHALNFKDGSTNTYDSGIALSFTNHNMGLIVTVITRNDLNDFIISLGNINPNIKKNAERPSTKSVTTPKNLLKKKVGYILQLPKPPKEIPKPLVRSLSSEEFLLKNGTQQGIIQKTFEDEDGELWMTVCFKDQLNETPYKGYILMDINTSQHFYPDNISKSNAAYLKQIILPGRHIIFQSSIVGSGELSHPTLVFIKPLPNASLFNNPITIEIYIQKP